jgi:polar amino acid transport system substrate-binding protein
LGAVAYVYAAGKVVEKSRAARGTSALAIDPVRRSRSARRRDRGRTSSPNRRSATTGKIDRPGVRLLVSTGSAYDLFLSRTIKHATIVRTGAAKDVVDVFVRDGLDVAAGVRPALEADMRRIPGLRMLPGRFMAIYQAMGTVRGRDAGAAYLCDFIEEMKASGFVAQSFVRNRVEGASVAPAPPARVSIR